MQTAVQWLRHRKVSSMALISGALVLVFGGLTLAIHDKLFIQWKVDGRELAVRRRVPGEPFRRRPAADRSGSWAKTCTLERPQWLRLNWAWIVFFSRWARSTCTSRTTSRSDVWVNFKLYGTIGLTLLFALATGFLARLEDPPEGQ